MAVTSLVMGGIFVFTCLLGNPFAAPWILLPFYGALILSLCLGILAIIRIKFVDPTLSGMGFAVGGIAMPILFLAWAVVRAMSR